MNFLLSLSTKNLWRYRRRTLITAGAIAFGIMMFIWTDSLILGIEKQSERSAVLYETGSAQILDPRYYTNIQYLPLKYVIEQPDRLLSGLESINVPATKRITFGGEIFHKDSSLPVRFFAVDPDTCGNVFKLDKMLSAGGSFIEKDKPEIMLGEKLAESLGISIGSIVDIRTRTRTGASQTLSLTVVGFINELNQNMHDGAGLLPLDIADQALDMNGSVTEVAVSIPEYKNLSREMQKINASLGLEESGLEIHSWDDLGGILANMMGSRRAVIFVILGLLVIIAAVGITNTMLIAVSERTREIGMMRAMGMNPREIRTAFLIEAGLIGLIGSLIGVLLALGLNAYSIYVGLDYGNIFNKIDVGISMPVIFKGSWNFETILIAPVFGVLISALVSLFPARKALKMDITECLSHQ